MKQYRSSCAYFAWIGHDLSGRSPLRLQVLDYDFYPPTSGLVKWASTRLTTPPDHRVIVAQVLPEGQSISHWNSQNKALFNEKTDYPPADFVYGLWGVRIVSERLMKFLACEIDPTEVQILPVILEREDGLKRYEGYYVMHPLREVDCLDYDQTELNLSSDSGLRHLAHWEAKPVLDSGKIPLDRRLFPMRSEEVERLVIRGDLARKLTLREFTNVFLYRLPVSS